MDLELQKKYSEELQKVQRERNELKHQLAEKDKEIEELKDMNALLQTFIQNKLGVFGIQGLKNDNEIYYFDTLVKLVKESEKQDIRHQVCEEIRKYIEEHNIGGADHISISNQFYKKLDQIEKGE